MKKRISGLLLVVCITLSMLPVAFASGSTIYVSSTGNDSNNGATEDTTVKTIERALELVSTGGTISISGSADSARPETNIPLYIEKEVTITGGTLTLNYAGIVLGADVTFDGVELAFANRVRNAIMANGHCLTLKDTVKSDTVKNTVHLFCGGLTGYAGFSEDAGSSGEILIQGCTALGNIYAGSISVDGTANEWGKPSVITFDNGFTGSSGQIYACGALEAVIDDGEMINPEYETPEPGVNAAVCRATGGVTINLTNKTVVVDGATGGSSNAAVNYVAAGSNPAVHTLTNIGALTLSGSDPILMPMAGSSIASNASVSVPYGARLDLTNFTNTTAADNLTIGSLAGGGTLVLGSDQTLTITGAVTGTTGVELSAAGNCITAENSTAGSFMIAGSFMKLTRGDNGVWTAEWLSIPVTNFTVTGATVSTAEKTANLPVSVTYADEEGYWDLDFATIDFIVAVNDVSVEYDDSENAYVDSATGLSFYPSTEEEAFIVEHGTAFSKGSYTIAITVPAENTTSGEAITRTATLTVTQATCNEHSGGTATCTEQAVCDNCGTKYGELDASNHASTTCTNGFYDCCGAYETATDSDSDGVYEISNAGQLYWFAQQVNGGQTTIKGKLTTNIEVNPGTFAADGSYLPQSGEAVRPWTPIGSDTAVYAGTFDGGSFTVSGLYFNDSTTDYVGLFGCVGESGKVQNVGVVNSYICGKYNVGGVVGWNDGAVTGCYNTGVVSGKDTVGGVEGWNDGAVTGCYNTGVVSGSGNVGGVVGQNGSSGTVTNCYNTGAVSGNQYVGGVVGNSNTFTDKSVTSCYNTGAVSGSSDVGGVVGCATANPAEKCYFLQTNETNYGLNGIGSRDYSGHAAPMSEEQFTSGEVCYLLNGDQTTITFKQTIGTEATPNFTGYKVYYGYLSCARDAEMVYTNTSVTAEKPGHTAGTATDNGDDTHDQSCSACGGLAVDNGNHSFDENTHKCICGKVEQFTITFNTDGGFAIAPITLDYGTAIPSVTAPIRTGYTFEGWDKEIPSTMPAENMTVTANWTANHYTITFVDTGDNTYAPITQAYGTEVIGLEDPTKAGYTFAGWDKEIPETMPAENMTLTALWVPIPTEAPTGVTANGPGDTDQTERAVTVAVTANNDYSYSYQWYSNTTESNQGGTVISGATNSQYRIPVGAEAGRIYYFYCVVTATRDDNGQTASTASNVVSVHLYSSPTAKELTYNGADQALVNAGVTDASRPMEYALAESESDVPTSGWSTEIPTGRDAGTYYVCYRLVDNRATEGNTTVEIKAKPVTVKADNKSATVNGSAPAYTYTVTGLCTGHTLSGVTAVCGDADTSAAATYEITLGGTPIIKDAQGNDVTANYAITTVNGTLTVSTPYVPPYIPPVIPTPEPEKPVTIPVTDKQTSVEIEVTISEGKATLENVDPNELEKVSNGESTKVSFDFSVIDEQITQVELPAETVEQITEASDDSEQTLEIVLSDDVSIEFNASALNEQIQKTEGTNLSVSVLPGKDAELTKEQTTAVGDRPAYDINVTSGGKHISDMGGKITVSAPYELRNGEKAGGLVVYYVDDNGNRERCETRYDEQTKLVSWETDHLSLYMIDYDETLAEVCDRGENCPLNDFTDTDPGEWYHNGIHYCVENELIVGLTDDLFAPNGTTTRAQIVTILWRLEGKPVVNYLMQFEDVASESWYTEAVRWAASENIVGGYGNGKFGPNDPITRQQMAAILYRYCQYKGIDVSVGEDTNILSYTDAFSISEWAIPAMQWACGSGMIQGIADGDGMKLDPSGSATRAQIATILWHFCDTIMDN